MKITLHPNNPQKNRLQQIADILDKNGVIAYPTDSGYALGCGLENKAGLEKIRRIRELSNRHHFTLMLKDMANMSEYAQLNNINFRLLKKILPGAYTVILPATKLVPSRLLHSKRKTIGIRISDHLFIQSLLDAIGEPIMSVSLHLDLEYFDADDVFEAIGNQVECVVDMGYCVCEPTTVIDLVEAPNLIRQGSASSDFLD